MHNKSKIMSRSSWKLDQTSNSHTHSPYPWVCSPFPPACRRQVAKFKVHVFSLFGSLRCVRKTERSVAVWLKPLQVCGLHVDLTVIACNGFSRAGGITVRLQYAHDYDTGARHALFEMLSVFCWWLWRFSLCRSSQLAGHDRGGTRSAEVWASWLHAGCSRPLFPEARRRF